MMLQKRTTNKRTREKLNWLASNITKYAYQEDLMAKMITRFSISERQAYRLLKVHRGECENTGRNTPRGALITDKKQINKDSCYFCNSTNNLIEHHISYIPEEVVLVCGSCHSKIHLIMRKQHQNEKERAEYMANLRTRVKELLRII